MTKKSRAPRATRKPISLLMLGDRTIAASEFKARCLEIMDEVEQTGVEVTITKHRKAVARLVPVKRAPFVGSMKGAAIIVGDIVGPIGDPWDTDDPYLT
jgi:prevent-host-death family protein